MNSYNSEQVFLGTWGEVWIDDEYMAEVKKFRAEVTIDYEDIGRVRNLMKGKKMVAISGEGEVSLHKVSSFMMSKISEKVKNGEVPSFTIVGNIDDPNAIGGERIALYDCKFQKVTLADWENGSVAEESYGFTFEDWEILDEATAST